MLEKKPQQTECDVCDGFEIILFEGPHISDIPCPKCQKAKHDAAFDKVLRKRLKSLGRLLEYPYKDLDILPRLRQRLEEFVTGEKGEGLTLFGRVGRGKTTIAAASAIEKGIRSRIWSVTYVDWPIQVKRLRGAFDRDRHVDPEFEQMEAMMRPAILILDEIGTKEGKEEKSSSYTAGALRDIIDERYRLRRPTLVTMNTSMKELSANLGEWGEKITSRLWEVNGKAVELTGPNRREEKCRQKGKTST